jgi:arylsulfatase A-like enzyme
VLPTVSAPNWGTHLKGAGPELHGYTSNSTRPTPEPRVVNQYGIFPSIFGEVRAAYPKAETGVLYDWPVIHYLFETNAVSLEQHLDAKDPEGYDGKDPKQKVEHYERCAALVADTAATYIREKKPLLVFVYLGAVDETGHIIGHDTPEYFATLKKTDDEVGRLVAAVNDAGIGQETVFLVVADHGGINKGHGGKTLLEIQTPWLIAGPGIKRGHSLDDVSVIHYDTAPTIARLLGLTPPQAWIGHPVADAFEQ